MGFAGWSHSRRANRFVHELGDMPVSGLVEKRIVIEVFEV